MAAGHLGFKKMCSPHWSATVLQSKEQIQWLVPTDSTGVRQLRSLLSPATQKNVHILIILVLIQFEALNALGTEDLWWHMAHTVLYYETFMTLCATAKAGVVCTSGTVVLGENISINTNAAYNLYVIQRNNPSCEIEAIQMFNKGSCTSVWTPLWFCATPSNTAICK